MGICHARSQPRRGLRTPLTFDWTAASEILSGFEGNDTLDGGDGDDTIIGGAGDDLMTGGAGADAFLVQALTDLTANTDHVTDFAFEDNIDLSLIAGLTFIGEAVFSGAVGEMRYALDYGTTAVEIDSTGDGVRDQRIVIDNASFTLKETAAGSGILIANELITAGGAQDDTLTGTANDRIILGKAINLSNFSSFGDGFGNLMLEVYNAGSQTTSAITIADYFVDSANEVETIQFSVDDGNGGSTLAGLNVTGTDSADALEGTAFLDYMRGRDGNDEMAGGGGDDRLRGDNGDDILYGEDGND